jgi:hypothetical protein
MKNSVLERLIVAMIKISIKNFYNLIAKFASKAEIY